MSALCEKNPHHSKEFTTAISKLLHGPVPGQSSLETHNLNVHALKMGETNVGCMG